MVLATLLSEASDPLSRRDHQALRNLCGVAPVTRRSGKRCVVSMRRAAHVRLRLVLYHWSRSNTMRQAETGMLNFASAAILIHAPYAVWPTVS